MRPIQDVPLVWLNQIHDRRRLVLSILGIAFATLLMFMQIGFRNALLDGQVEILRLLDADLFLVSRTKVSLYLSDTFPRRRLYQALECDGVRAANGVYLENVKFGWKNPRTGLIRPIRVIAYDPRKTVFLDDDVRRVSTRLSTPDTALFDRGSRPTFGVPEVGQVYEVGRRDLRVVGTFVLGADFSNDGNLIMSDTTFANLDADDVTPAERLGNVELGLVKLVAGADLDQTQRCLQARLPADVLVLTKPQYIAEETRFWSRTTPIGTVFLLGTAVGFIVGVVIGYQIIYTSVNNNLRQFATLKAIGYGNRYLVGAVLREGWVLALLGFVPGLIVSALLYTIMASTSNLLMRMTPARIALILVLTVVMCTVSAPVAVRKVLASDPAEVF